MGEPSLGKEIHAIELASMLGFRGAPHIRRQRAVRWMVSLGIGVQHYPGGRWFTTLTRLRSVATANHVWQEAIRRGYSE